MKYFPSILLFAALATGCTKKQIHAYRHDLALLQRATSVVELAGNSGNSRIAVCPEFQGKIMTSCNNGLEGESFGWINRQNLKEDFTGSGGSYAGEERVWIGPLGGQFSFYYQQIKPLNEDNWKVPVAFNNEPFTVTCSTKKQVLMHKKLDLVNFVGTRFQLLLNRKITLFDNSEIAMALSVSLPDELKVAGYETRHSLKLSDTCRLKQNSGLVALWSLVMLNGYDDAITVVPLKKSVKTAEINQYLGALKSDRLKVKNNTLLYKTDGKYRSKIGIPPQLCKPVYGSYHPTTNTLNIVQFSFNENDSLYFNSEVSTQENPYRGEVIPIYNNGPMDLLVANENTFYELENTSSMDAFAAGKREIYHWQRVYHFTGTKKQLNSLCVELLGIQLSEISF